jgi:hypothetical protein
MKSIKFKGDDELKKQPDPNNNTPKDSKRPQRLDKLKFEVGQEMGIYNKEKN